MAIQFAAVTSENGLSVKLRSSKSAKNESNILVKLPVGTVVRVQEQGDDWCRVECSYNGTAYSGFMMSDFLEPTDAPSGDEVEESVDSDEEQVVCASGCGVWIPCASLDAAKASEK